MRAERIALGAMCVVMMTLPFAHTIALRNVALGVALVGTAFAWRRLELSWPPMLWFFGALATLGGISLLWSVDPAYSRGELKSELLYPLVVYTLMFAVCRDRRGLAWCGVATAFAVVLSMSGPFVAWLDWTSGRPQAGVLYTGAGFYSSWIAVVYPFALATALAPDLDKRWRAAALVAAVLALAAGFATFNRTFPYVAAIQTFLLLWVFYAQRRSHHLRLAIVSLAVIAVFSAGLAWIHTTRLAPLPRDEQDLLASLQHDVRWRMWSETAERIAATPLRGAGFGRGILRGELQARYPDTFLWHAHNVVLDWGLQMGMPGIALVFALFAGALWRLGIAYRASAWAVRPYVIAAMVMVIGVFLKNQTDDLFVRHGALIFWAALGAVMGVAARMKPPRLLQE